MRRLERLPELAADDLRVPELGMMLATDLAVLDHSDGTVLLIANAILHPTPTTAASTGRTTTRWPGWTR